VPSGNNFYVAPNGSPSGTGSISSPWDLQTALNKPSSIVSGATIYLRGGTYSGKYVSSLTGTASTPITVKSFPGEWAIIDGYKTTTLSAAISSTSTTLTFVNALGINVQSSVWIDGECIQMGSKNGNTFTGCVRGFRDSTPASHSTTSTAIVGIEDALTINGSYTIYRDFEVMHSDPNRVYSGDVIGDHVLPYRGEGLAVYGHHTKFINLILHDNREGIGFWHTATDSEIYGCIIFNNGIVDGVRGHGHGIYMQNQTGTKRIVDNLSFNNFATGMKGYGQDNYANGLYFEGNASFNNGSPSAVPSNQAGYNSGHRFVNLFVGTTTFPTNQVTVVNNYLYHSAGTMSELGNLGLGYETSGNTNLVVQGNYVMGGHMAMTVDGWLDAQVTGNTLYTTALPAGSGATEVMASVHTSAPQNHNWNNNTYFDMATQQNGVSYTFAFNSATNRFGNLRLAYTDSGSSTNKGWKQWTGYDGSSSYSMSKPTGQKVVVRANQYEPGRAHIIVYNWSLTKKVDVDLSSVLQPGQAYEIRNVQNYFAPPLLTGTYIGGSIQLPMNGLTVAAPIGLGYTPQSTAPEFAVFVVIKR
jgi:hypothetical protein